MKILGHAHAHRRILIALFLGAIYMVLALVGGWLAGSLALLADAGHLLVHNGALLVAFFVSALAHRERGGVAGYGRLEALGGYTNGLLLAGVALWVGWEAWERFHGLTHDPHHLEVDGGLMTGVAFIGFVLHGASAWVLHGGRRHSLNVYAVYLHLMYDVAATVVAFTVGLAVEMGAPEALDALAGGLIALLILRSAVRLVRRSGRYLLDEEGENAPSLDKIKKALEKLSHIENAHDLFLRTGRSGELHLGAHLVLKKTCLEGRHWDSCRREAEKMLREKFNIAYSVLQVEAPDEEH